MKLDLGKNIMLVSIYSFDMETKQRLPRLPPRGGGGGGGLTDDTAAICRKEVKSISVT